MPELPEVENLVIALRKVLQKRRITQVVVHNESVLETPRSFLEKEIPGRRIVRVGRRGKFIHLDLSKGLTLWLHLGMTGQLFLENPPPSLRPHTHLMLSFAGSKEQLFYRDVRRFGRIALAFTGESRYPRGVQQLGLEPEEWDTEAFVSQFKERRGRIKSLLLNQTLVAGLGNIYADESLHRAGIRPLRRAHEISRGRLGRLHEAICEVLEEAIRCGGSSIDDYLHLDGTQGYFQNFHRVYGRAGEDCRRCGTKIRKVKLSGRTSSFCPHCQR